jgi:dihydrofolate reductase
MKVDVIMCLSNYSILGVNNDLYVKIDEDLKYFKRITSDNY